jgi:sortase B
VQAQDNTYYLNHTFLGKTSAYGCVFLDSGAVMTAGKTSQNLVLYGHNMKNGEMFGQLGNYRDLNFYRVNPVIYFNALYREDVWKVFAVYIINTKPGDDNGYVFDYMQADFTDDEVFMEFVKETKRRSVLNIPVEISPGDQLLTLSTCDYTFDDARLVVVAKRVASPGEATVDVMRARTNLAPLYPDAWYRKFGGKKPTEEQMFAYSDVF